MPIFFHLRELTACLQRDLRCLPWHPHLRREAAQGSGATPAPRPSTL